MSGVKKIGILTSLCRMGSFKVILSSVGETLKSTLSRIGFINADAKPIGGMDYFLSRIESLHTQVQRIGGLTCRIYAAQVAPSSPYLEISPEVVWLLVGGTENDVFSNTTWYVD